MSIDVNAIEQTVVVTAVGDEVNVNIIDQPVLVSVTDQIVEVEASGAAGPQGPAGAGVAAGGTTGQVLIKASNTNYDTTWTNAGAGTVYSVNASGSTGISVTGGPITGAGTLTITNTAPDQVVSLTGGGTTTITGTYPNFTISSADSTVGTVTSVNMTVPTGLTISGNPITSAGTLALALASGYSIPTTASQSTWDAAYNDKINSASVTGTATKTLTLTQQDGGTITANWSDIDTGLTSVGLSMPSAFSVANSPLTSNGTLAVTGAGTASQYVRGDGALADFPTTGGGGSSVSYYLNGSVNQGTLVGNVYYEINKTPILGAGTDFTINADGYIAQFITDANDPDQLKIPAGNWNFELYFSASSNGGSPTFYVELSKYNGTTFTAIASSSAIPEGITFGISISSYHTTLAVPETVLLATDRLAVRVYVVHSGRIITMHTEGSHLSEIVTTFSTGLNALNGLTDQVQYFATGTSGTDFAISSATDTHTFNLPIASGTNTGKLSNTDWTSFNAKQNAITLTTTGSSGASTFVSNTLNVPTYTLTGLGGVPSTRSITINGTAFDLSADRSYSVGTVTSITLATGTTGTDVNVSNGTITTSGTITLNIPDASATARGLVTTGTQTIAGAKTFTSEVTSTNFILSGGTGNTGLYYGHTNKVVLANYVVGGGIDFETNGGAINMVLDASANLSVVGSVTAASLIKSGGTSSQFLKADGSVDSSTYYLASNPSGYTTNVGTVTSVAATAGTGITISGSPITTSGTLTITNSAPDQVVALTASTGISVSGTYPNFTITNTSPSSGGTVTSVGLSSATSGVTIGSSPITTSGTITLAIATATTSQNGLLSSTDWATFNAKQNAITLTTTGTSGAATLVGSTLNIPQYADQFVGTVTSVAALTIGTTGTDLSSTVANGTTTPVITLQVPTASATNRGALSSADWTTFNNKQSTITNPVTGTGTTNYLPKWTSGSAIGNSAITDDGTVITYGSGSGLKQIYINAGGYDLVLGASGGGMFGFTSTNASLVFTTTAKPLGIGTGNTQPLVFGTNQLEGMRLTSGGNLLVGTTTDSGEKLVVSGTSLITGAATFSSSVTATAGVFNLNTTDGGFKVVGVNASPTNLAYLSNNYFTKIYTRNHNFGITFFDQDNNNVGIQAADLVNGSSAKAIIINPYGGNLLVGTTNDSGEKLQVNGSAKVSGKLTGADAIFNLGATTAFEINSVTNYNSSVNYLVNGTSYFTAQVLGDATNLGDYRVYSYSAGEVFKLKYSTGAATFSSTIKTAAPSGGTAKPFKIGAAASVSPTSPNRTIEIEIDGTTYYLSAKTTNN